MKKIMLDTNAYSNLLKGNTRILQILEEAETVYFSVIVIAELLYGFKLGSKEKDNIITLKKFLNKSKVQIKEIGYETSEVFANVKKQLRNIGKPIPINDLWIASQCMEDGVALLTLDEHFSLVTGLRLVLNSET